MSTDRRPARFGPLDEPAESGRSHYPPIADYAYISDCESNGLIAPGGNVEWLCIPRPDSPSVFGAILDRSAGGFRFGPADVLVPAARRYIPGTMVVETSWNTATGWAIVRDTLLMGPWHHDDTRDSTHKRAPTDYDAEHILLRTVRCVNGEVQMTIDCEPVFDYGQLLGRWEYSGENYRQGVCRAEGSDVALTLTSDINLGFEGPRALARTLVKEGETRFVALSWGPVAAPTTYEEAYRREVWTAHHWQHWLARGHFPDHPWRAFLERSALTLKGLTYAPSGAIIAAATTSLPETPHGERNWDYRYSWIRDSTFALWGLYTLGFDWEANDFMNFVADAAEGPGDLQVMYGVGGERELEERILDHLEGYDEARPVRIGNGAYNQRQHDVWGAVLDSFYLHMKSRDRLDERIWPIIVRQVKEALEHWRQPDRGIWEVRGEPKHFTSSKVMCWVAADRGARLARAAQRARVRPRVAGGRRRDPRRDLREGRGRARRLHPALRHQGARRVIAPVAARPLPAPRRLAHPGDGPGNRRRALSRRADPALQDRGDRRRLAGRGGRLRDLFVLARVGAGRDRRDRACPPAVREAAVVRQPAGPVRGGDRPAQRAPPRQLPAGVHPSRADQRGHAPDQRRSTRRRTRRRWRPGPVRGRRTMRQPPTTTRPARHPALRTGAEADQLAAQPRQCVARDLPKHALVARFGPRDR